MTDEMDNLPENRRWTAKRKASLVLEIIKGKTTAAEASRAYDLTVTEIEEWLADAMAGMENQLKARPKDIAQQYETEIKELRAKVGELVLQNDVLKKLSRLPGSGSNE